MAIHKQLIYTWREYLGADVHHPLIAPLARWLYDNAGLQDCENCPREVVPPLYWNLARLIYKTDEHAARALLRDGTQSGSGNIRSVKNNNEEDSSAA